MKKPTEKQLKLTYDFLKHMHIFGLEFSTKEDIDTLTWALILIAFAGITLTVGTHWAVTSFSLVIAILFIGTRIIERNKERKSIDDITKKIKTVFGELYEKK